MDRDELTYEILWQAARLTDIEDEAADTRLMIRKMLDRVAELDDQNPAYLQSFLYPGKASVFDADGFGVYRDR